MRRPRRNMAHLARKLMAMQPTEPKALAFPRWRAALEHPFTKTAVILFQLTAISIAAGGALFAFQNLSQAQRMAAYQLLATAAAPPAAKWSAIKSILTSDGAVQSPSMGCLRPDSGPPRTLLCGVARNMEIVGPSPTEPYEISGLDMHSTGYAAGRLANVAFTGGNFNRAEFDLTDFEVVTFTGASMFGTLVVTPRDSSPNLRIERSALPFARIQGKDLSAVIIETSDVSSFVVRGRDVQLPVFIGNYIRPGSRPPQVNGQDRSDLVRYICDVPSGTVGILPQVHPDCEQYVAPESD